MSGRLMNYIKLTHRKSWCLQKALITAKVWLKNETRAFAATLKSKKAKKKKKERKKERKVSTFLRTDINGCNKLIGLMEYDTFFNSFLEAIII